MYCYVINKSWTCGSLPNNKAINVVFITFWNYWLIVWMKPIVIYDDNQDDIFLLENPPFMLTQNLLRFIINWCGTKLKMISLGWCIATSVFFKAFFCNLVKKREGMKVTKGFNFFWEKMGPSWHIMKKQILNLLFLKICFDKLQKYSWNSFLFLTFAFDL